MLKRNGKKTSVGILGSGNIGSDLLFKIQRSQYLECSLFVGQNAQSEGLKRASSLGIRTSYTSIQAFLDNPSLCDIVFDATTAEAHKDHAKVFKKLKIFTIDMTPSKVGYMCVPLINLDEGIMMQNVNMISCGGQANTPIIQALMKVHPEIPYIEVVSSISSFSAGIGTRNNIDEYTQTTSDAIMSLTHVPKAKTIIILNPANPPMLMHNTIYAKISNPKKELLTKSVNDVVKKLQQYVPGYKLILGPVEENNRITIMTEVVGMGDYLPTYAGNLDIINCAAIAVAEAYAKKTIQ